MLKFPPVFVQKILCFVQISKSFVQKHETKTAGTGENDGNIRKTSNDIRRKQQLLPRKTITASGGNDSKIREKHAQKSYRFYTKVFEFCTNS